MIEENKGENTTKTPEVAEKTENVVVSEVKEFQIPKSRFDEVNTKYKELQKKVAQFEKEKQQREQEKLVSENRFKELWEKSETERKKYEIINLKNELLDNAITNKKLNPKLKKIITGNNEEEIQKSIEEALDFQKEFENNLRDINKATDRSPAPKNINNDNIDWMQYYKDNPSEALK